MDRAQVSQLIRYLPHSLLGVPQVWVAALDITLRDAVGAEEQMNAARIGIGEFFDLCGNPRGERGDIGFVGGPACDVVAPNGAQAAAPIELSDEVLAT